ncbi:NUDIX hydrolase [Nocardia sp. BMG51109]|uniref:NUDIX hydrolase n=1 Tax=Nocardia sp. BMG51109 TaxID=1056816 RepID=UPI0009FC1030|nr:NUDIX domain-containing protein [Nocardia sp. BMG51109]
MSFRIAAYGVCFEQGRVLLARHVAEGGETTWTLPDGGVEHTEDPFDAVTRELHEETGYEGVVERLLGVDSRVIPAAVARAGVEHQNVGIFYRVRVTGGRISTATSEAQERSDRPRKKGGMPDYSAPRLVKSKDPPSMPQEMIRSG